MIFVSRATRSLTFSMQISLRNVFMWAVVGLPLAALASVLLVFPGYIFHHSQTSRVSSI